MVGRVLRAGHSPEDNIGGNTALLRLAQSSLSPFVEELVLLIAPRVSLVLVSFKSRSVPRWGKAFVAWQAAALYKQGLAPKVIITGGCPRMCDLAVAYGIPEDAIIFDRDSRTTYDDARNCRRIFEEHGVKAAIVVTSPYHVLRAKRVFGRFMDGGVKLFFYPAQESWFSALNWWQSKSRWKAVC